jgi:type IV pilus assembly protein PilW
MIAITLGLIVLAGVIGVLLANRESYRTSEALSRMQENARFTFEVLGRSIRAAGGNPCGATKVANVLNNRNSNQSTDWWANCGNNWVNNAVRGYEANDAQFPQQVGSDVTQRVAGTDALILMSAALDEGVVITECTQDSAQFKVNTTQHGLEDGDIVMACDNDHAAIFQVTNVQNNVTIVHNTGEGSPGNCSKGLGYPTPPVCSTNGNSYTFAEGGFLAKLSAEAWYIGNNSRRGRSLYRIYLARSGNNPTTTEEVVPDVRDMQLVYLTQTGATLATNYVAADTIDWNAVAAGTTRVVAVRLEITTEAPDVKFNGAALTRTWATVVQIRNSQP